MTPKQRLLAKLRAQLLGEDAQLAAEALRELSLEYQAAVAIGSAREPHRARFIEAAGKRRTLTEWSQTLRIPRRTLHDRIAREGSAYIDRVLAEGSP